MFLLKHIHLLWIAHDPIAITGAAAQSMVHANFRKPCIASFLPLFSKQLRQTSAISHIILKTKLNLMAVQPILLVSTGNSRVIGLNLLHPCRCWEILLQKLNACGLCSLGIMNVCSKLQMNPPRVYLGSRFGPSCGLNIQSIGTRSTLVLNQYDQVCFCYIHPMIFRWSPVESIMDSHDGWWHKNERHV